jgi:hypothetical protein
MKTCSGLLCVCLLPKHCSVHVRAEAEETVFIIDTGRVLCEVQAEAEETIE